MPPSVVQEVSVTPAVDSRQKGDDALMKHLFLTATTCLWLLCLALLTPQTVQAVHPLYDYFYIEAQRQRQLQHYDVAYSLLQYCLQLQPDAPSALYDMALCQLMLRQTEQAEALLQRAVRLDPSCYWYARTLGVQLQQHDDLQPAIDLWKQMSLRFPGKAEPLYALADLYTRQEQYPEAIATLQHMEQLSGPSEEISSEQIRLHLLAGQQEEALAEAEQLARLHPGDLRLTVRLADTQLQCGHDTEALRLYRQVLDSEPLQPQARLSLMAYEAAYGDTLSYTRQVDSLLMCDGIPCEQKVEALRRLIATTSSSPSPTDTTAVADTTRLLPLLRRLVEHEPYEPAGLELYAQYLYAHELKSEAIPILQRLLQVQPEHSAARMTLLGEAATRQDNDEVMRLCQGGVESTPQVLEFHFYLGISYLSTDHPAEALAAARGGIAQVATDSDSQLVSDLYALAGDASHTLGLRDSCYQAYEAALRYNPDNMPVLNNYAYYLSEEGVNLERAEEMSHRTVEAQPDNATYLDTYAWILYALGRYTQARIYIDQAMQHGGTEEPVLLEHCGDIYYRSGDAAGALSYWQQAWDKGARSPSLEKKIKTKKLKKK